MWYFKLYVPTGAPAAATVGTNLLYYSRVIAMKAAISFLLWLSEELIFLGTISDDTEAVVC
jgi:hypothetical protein